MHSFRSIKNTEEEEQANKMVSKQIRVTQNLHTLEHHNTHQKQINNQLSKKKRLRGLSQSESKETRSNPRLLGKELKPFTN